MEVWGVLLQGRGLLDFEGEDVTYLCDRWATVNQWDVSERVLGRWGKRLDLVYCVCSTRLKQNKAPSCEYVTKDDKPAGLNSLCGLLRLLEGRGVRKVYLFGADGGGEYYPGFRFDLKAERVEAKDRALRKDARNMDRFRTGMEVINVTNNSNINIFPKLSYGELRRLRHIC